MRIDVEMESLQRYFYYQMRQNLEINQGLTARARIGLETA
jgi:hypothetical protein